VAAEPITAAIALGGNLGAVPEAFVFARRQLAARADVRVTALSSVYRTPAWGKTDQPDFLNAALLVETTLDADSLLALCLDIERAAGRERHEKWGPRSLDLDIVFFGNLTCERPHLKLPHPHAAERAFVLVPLAEIAPQARIGDVEVRALRDALDVTAIQKDADATDTFQKI
jgi:2-amino-4-hydroxy-6-hydroxymethyldihydropteridine diphosphokinase